MMRFTLRQTDEYERLVEFMKQYGLEFHDGEEGIPVTNVLKCWKVTQGYRAASDEITENNDYLVGGVILGERCGEYVVDGIAVDPVLRKTGLGTVMMKKLIKEVEKLEGESIYLVAKVPEFFRTLGFEEIDAESCTHLFSCPKCDQFNVSCFPKAMKLELDKKEK